MPSSPFTQFDEDPARLPEGFKRVAYDADTAVYTFKDRNGTLYRGEPGNAYGKLTPLTMDASAPIERVRPGAFASKNPRSKSAGPGPTSSRTSTAAKSPPSTFHDFLPPSLMTNSTMSGKSSSISTGTSGHGPGAQFRDAAKKVTAMQGVVHGLRRSITTLRKGPPSGGSGLGRGENRHHHHHRGRADDREERERLIASSSSGGLYRSSTVSTTRTDRSSITITGRPVTHS